jgi:flagellar hook-associated protein FlgK
MAIDAMSSGMAGIHRGMQGLQKNAQEIVSATTNREGPGSLEKPAVEMLSNQQQVEASSKVVKAQDDMLGSLLDEMA